jgi:hypothetical protein
VAEQQVLQRQPALHLKHLAQWEKLEPDRIRSSGRATRAGIHAARVEVRPSTQQLTSSIRARKLGLRYNP